MNKYVVCMSVDGRIDLLIDWHIHETELETEE